MPYVIKVRYYIKWKQEAIETQKCHDTDVKKLRSFNNTLQLYVHCFGVRYCVPQSSALYYVSLFVAGIIWNFIPHVMMHGTCTENWECYTFIYTFAHNNYITYYTWIWYLYHQLEQCQNTHSIKNWGSLNKHNLVSSFQP